MSETVTVPDFWLTSGFHLLEETAEGTLAVTPEYIRAYLKRAELAPVEESCANEVALHTSLVEDPFQSVEDSRITALADQHDNITAHLTEGEAQMLLYRNPDAIARIIAAMTSVGD